MKKLLVMLAMVSMSAAVMAQDDEQDPTEKYSVATNSFGSNWFVQANLVGSAFYSDQEHGMDLAKSPFKGFRNNLGFSVALGKWFTPGLGLRTKINAAWGRTVVSGDKKLNASKYWMAQEDVLLNLSDIICGYNESRVWNFIPYIGAGFARNMSHDVYSMGLNAGLLNTFRLSRKVMLNLDVNMATYEDRFDGVAEPTCKSFFPSRDRVLNVEIGLTYNLGKAKWKKTPDVEAIKALSQGEIDALNAQLADEQAENAKMRQIVAEEKSKAESTVNTVKEVVAAPVSVFFNIGKSKIASRKDMQNVKDLVEAAKASGAKFVVTGYADSKTGSKAYNQKLSQKRAETVANELVKLGVSRDNIETKAEGGVNTLSPFSYNRRATVTLK